MKYLNIIKWVFTALLAAALEPLKSQLSSTPILNLRPSTVKTVTVAEDFNPPQDNDEWKPKGFLYI